MRRWVSLFSGIMAVIAVSGCVKLTFREDLTANGNYQESKVREIAKSSTDILDYVQKITNQKEMQIYPDRASTLVYSNNTNFKFWATDFFRTYCNEKSGDLYQWSISSSMNFSIPFAYSEKIIVCENSGQINSALIYEEYPELSQKLHFRINEIFATAAYFENYVKKNKLYGYTSKNGIITFPQKRIYELQPEVIQQGAKKYVVRSISDQYSVLFYFKNETSNPVAIELLRSYVTINGEKYNIKFDAQAWKFYSNGLESADVFSGPEGSKGSKLRFNPGQTLFGEFEFQIPGRTQINENDIKDFVFYVDGIRCDGFKKIDYYTRYKKTFKEGY